jgi:multidrug efflux pump subunit AcrB
VVVEIRGQEMDTLADLAERTAETMGGMSAFRNVSVSMDITKPEYQVRGDRTKAAELGVPVCAR